MMILYNFSYLSAFSAFGASFRVESEPWGLSVSFEGRTVISLSFGLEDDIFFVGVDGGLSLDPGVKHFFFFASFGGKHDGGLFTFVVLEVA